jgi:prepilin-type processing-associated H-X9-DG protein
VYKWEGATFLDRDTAVIRGDYSPPYIGNFFKQNQWTNSSGRALLADNAYWVLEVDQPNADGTIPPTYAPEGSLFPLGATYSFWRHGRFPKVKGGQYVMNNSGQVAYNVMFCDGHVSTLRTMKDGFIAVRQRFPN